VLNLVNSNAPALAGTINLLGHSVVLVNSYTQLSGISHLIIPGNGSIAGVISEIDFDDSLRPALIDYISSGRHLLGICLGMQLLGINSEESVDSKCLGTFSLSIEAMARNSGNLRVPHVGWNQVFHTSSSPIFENIPSGSDFYFSHSFAVVDQSFSIASTEYGITFSSSINIGNVYGVQFHPERSQFVGGLLLNNFLALR
jgi:glutamine amidotransferase